MKKFLDAIGKYGLPIVLGAAIGSTIMVPFAIQDLTMEVNKLNKTLKTQKTSDDTVAEK